MIIVNYDKIFYIVEFILFQIAFFLGLYTTSHYLNHKNYFNKSVKISKNSIKKLSHLTIIIFIIVLVVNIIIFLKTGFAIFSDNPTVSKVDNFTDGMGIYRRILWSIGTLSIIGSIILILVRYKIQLFSTILIILIIISMGSGSKGALLIFIFYIYILSNHPLFNLLSISKKMRKYLKILFFLAISIALTVLTIENGNFEKAIFMLFNRLLYNGDVVLYYYNSNIHEYFSNYDFFKYLHDIFNGPLAMFRLVPYELPLGFVMVREFNNGNLPFDSILGPNTPFYIVSDLYFGPIIGIFYSMFVGFVIAFSRYLFLKTRSNLVTLLLMTWLYMSSFTLIIEAPLFVTRLFEMILFLTPILIILQLVYFNSKGKPYEKN
jgi:hypothetical protein